jgi:uncharacterized coiled-coil DUF342 family protein
MIADRELRLRQRIDDLRDERDTAREQLDAARRDRRKLRNRVRTLERSLALWRLRATQRTKR